MTKRFIAGIILLTGFVGFFNTASAKNVEIKKKWFLADTTRQPKKEIQALSISRSLNVDGLLDEPEWREAPEAAVVKRRVPDVVRDDFVGALPRPAEVAANLG